MRLNRVQNQTGGGMEHHWIAFGSIPKQIRQSSKSNEGKHGTQPGDAKKD